MDVTPLISKDKKIITAYGNNKFTIGSEKIEGNIILSPSSVSNWDIDNVSQLTDINIVQTIPIEHTEIVIIGTGQNHINLNTNILNYFKEKNVAIEAMNTGAACRTYNILVFEGRDVTAALICI